MKNEVKQQVQRRKSTMKKAVVTVLGLDKVGITAKVCTVLADTNINILDISQTIVGGYFNMVMVVDITEAKDAFAEAAEKLQAVGEELGLEIKIQHTDIFDAMHRI
jgi:ACT domain-containing protein